MSRMTYDMKYIILNQIVNKIPSWHLRRFIYRRFGIKIGKGSRIAINTVVIDPDKITIGDNSIINEFCHLDGRGGLEIEDNVSISVYSKIITASHKSNSSSFEYYTKPTRIKTNAWIGCSALILDGSTVERNVIIGAGSVLKGITVEDGIYVGNPIRLLKKRNLETKYTLHYHPFFR